MEDVVGEFEVCCVIEDGEGYCDGEVEVDVFDFLCFCFVLKGFDCGFLYDFDCVDVLFFGFGFEKEVELIFCGFGELIGGVK